MYDIKYPYSRPNVNNEDIRAVVRTLKSQYLAQGKIVKKFEEEIKKKFRVKNSIVCNSGTAALHSVYKSLGLNKSNGLITSPITFLATANAARMCNASVYFADVDPVSGLITPETLEKAFKEVPFNVKVVTLVHLGGHICDLEGISKVAKKYNSYIVEDACHAIGAKYYKKNKKSFFVGSCSNYSIASTFSFHAIKNITMGEGGCITTNDNNLAEDIRLNISHGMIRDKKKMKNFPDNSPWYYQMFDIGWNYRASEISCALGLSQFRRIDKIIYKRSKIADYYKKFLHKSDYMQLPKYYDNTDSAGWHLFQLSIDFENLGKSKESFINYLKALSIGTQVHYIPLIYQPYYKGYTKVKNLSGAIKFYKDTISVPMYTNLNKSCVRYIAESINNFFKIKTKNYSTQKIKIRKALKKDKLLIFNWFNDPENIKYKLRTNTKISADEHSLWFKNILSNKNNFLWIVEKKNNSVGQIRLDYKGKKRYEIDIYIEKKFRRQNIATYALKEVEKKLGNGKVILSKVKKNNLRSFRFFKGNEYLLYSQSSKVWVLRKVT